MRLIVRSFILSFGVFGRMILPAIGIFLAGTLITTLLDLVFAGYASRVSGPIIATFLALFGMRTALAQMGDHRAHDYQTLALYAVLYGVVLILAKGVALTLSDVAAVFYADARLGGALSWYTFQNADENLQRAFTWNAFSAKAVVGLVLYTSVYVVLAVPLASAARAAGQTSPSAPFFHGLGRQFLPLFVVFAVSFFVQFFFNLFAFVFAVLPVILSIVSIAVSQSLPEFDPGVIAMGLASSAGLLWLNAWTWSAAALALVESDETRAAPRGAAAGMGGGPAHDLAPDLAHDLRALRKSRG